MNVMEKYSTFPKNASRELAIQWLMSYLGHSLEGGVLPLCRDAISICYCSHPLQPIVLEVYRLKIETVCCNRLWRTSNCLRDSIFCLECFSTSCFTKCKEHSLPYNFPTAGWGKTAGILPFPKEFVWSERQSHPGFELGLPILYPTMITVVLWAWQRRYAVNNSTLNKTTWIFFRSRDESN